MIKVTVELLPKGQEENKRLLGEILIANDATGDTENGNYIATLKAEYTDNRKGRVTNFHRKNQSVMSLVGAFLKLWGHTKHSPAFLQKI